MFTILKIKICLQLAKKVLRKDAVPFTDSVIYKGQQLNFKWALRVSNTIAYRITNQRTSLNFNDSAFTNRKTLDFVSPSIGFSKLDKYKNLHDFEFQFGSYQVVDTKIVRNFIYSNNIEQNNYKRHNLDVRLKYRFNYMFLKNLDSKIKPSIGISTGIQYHYADFIPASKMSVPSSTNLFTVPLILEPSLNYFISKNVFLFCSIPIQFSGLELKIYHSDNPSVPQNLKTTTSLTAQKLFDNLVFNFTFGMNIKIK